MNSKPIGIFDSGVGGTSIWQEIVRALPHENTIYLADSKNAPYGKKNKAEITALSIKNTEKLLHMGCKMIVVACNTATTNAIKTLRTTFDVPFIGIEPAIKPAAIQTQTKKVGVLATKGTLTSKLFAKTSDTYASEIEVIEVIGEGLVELIENNKIESSELHNLLTSYMQPMLREGVDYLVLGCSHYPYLIPQLQKILPQHIQIIDSGAAVARQTKSILTQFELLNSKDENVATHQLYTNSTVTALHSILKKTNILYTITYLNF